MIGGGRLDVALEAQSSIEIHSLEIIGLWFEANGRAGLCENRSSIGRRLRPSSVCALLLSLYIYRLTFCQIAQTASADWGLRTFIDFIEKLIINNDRTARDYKAYFSYRSRHCYCCWRMTRPKTFYKRSLWPERITIDRIDGRVL